MQIAADVVRQRHWPFFRRKNLENLDKTMVPWVGHKPRKGRNVLAAVGHHRKVHKLGKAQRLKVLRDFLQARLRSEERRVGKEGRTGERRTDEREDEGKQ